MYARRPACHVEPDLTDDLQGRQRINTINLRQVAPSRRVEILMDVKARRLPLARAVCGQASAEAIRLPHVSQTSGDTRQSAAHTLATAAAETYTAPGPAATQRDTRPASALPRPWRS